MAHILIIGGSGMLAGLCEALAAEGHMVSLIARSHTKLRQMAERIDSLLPLAADYHNAAALTEAIEAAIDTYGPIEQAVCWIHSDAPDTPLQVAPYVKGVFCHVLGSAAGDPSQPKLLQDWRDRFAAFPDLHYKQAVLGFIRLPQQGSRWLTNPEISAGVGKALASNDDVTVVGSVTPWSERPQ